ncbi:uncharacterized protein LTR77_002874 [Saxophila tyrrhenica]|uniref:Uncharacterized protein n=1 Tax=Saxophila tyrrhenica TaxID=1690608 RepID=A0AAV9PFU1_9PEZI|nr:hypothetical protein LTR77_002874 [Saxophila tyrrhenica]
MRATLISALLGLLSALGEAQFPPTPTDLTVVKSKVDSRVTLSWKETDICPGSKAYSGYVHLPGSSLEDVGGYDVNTYFLYFEAQNSPATAPLAMWFAGGPGSSSTFTALDGSNTPCYVNPQGNGTVKSKYSFNENVNVLYIDQPAQVGFSYNALMNATSDGFLFKPVKEGKPLPTGSNADLLGTFPTQKYSETATTTVQAGRTIWHFAENWLSSFPGYRTCSKDIGIWGSSYGGYWAPEFATQLSKNLGALSKEHPLACKKLRIDNIGITNGCIDAPTQAQGWPELAYNNTYDHPFGPEKLYEASINNITKPDGLLDKIEHCRTLGKAGDPEFNGRNATVNKACMDAHSYFLFSVKGSFPKMNKVSKTPSPSHPPLPQSNKVRPALPLQLRLQVLRPEMQRRLDTRANLPQRRGRQQSLGVPLNISVSSLVVLSNFGWVPDLPPPYDRPLAKLTGDFVRQDGLARFEYLLRNGVKVALIYGDIDFQCPWTGAENTALTAQWPGKSSFANAGYERLQGVEEQGTDHGALIKQAGLLSFARVLRAGHDTGNYAPASVAAIFDRTFGGVDVVGGKVKAGEGYASTGPKDSRGCREEYPEDLPRTCVVNGEYLKPDVPRE